MPIPSGYEDLAKSLKMSKKCLLGGFGAPPRKCRKNVQKMSEVRRAALWMSLKVHKMPPKCPKRHFKTSLRHFFDILGSVKVQEGGGGFAAAHLLSVCQKNVLKTSLNVF